MYGGGRGAGQVGEGQTEGMPATSCLLYLRV